MYSLLMEDLARERERAMLREAGERRLAAQAAARPHRGAAPTVGVLRRAVGRALVASGNWVGGGVRSGAR